MVQDSFCDFMLEMISAASREPAVADPAINTVINAVSETKTWLLTCPSHSACENSKDSELQS